MRIRIQLQRYLMFDSLVQLILTAHYHKLCAKCACVLKTSAIIYNTFWIAILETVEEKQACVIAGAGAGAAGSHKLSYAGWYIIYCVALYCCWFLLVVSDFQWFNFIFFNRTINLNYLIIKLSFCMRLVRTKYPKYIFILSFFSIYFFYSMTHR